MTVPDLTDALDRVTRLPHVLGVMLVSLEDGLVIAEALSAGMESRAAAALAASLSNRLEKTTGEAGLNHPTFYHLVAEGGSVLAMPSTRGTLVVVVASPEVNIGMVRMEMTRVAESAV